MLCWGIQVINELDLGWIQVEVIKTKQKIDPLDIILLYDTNGYAPRGSNK